METNPDLKWCTRPGCENLVQLDQNSETLFVKCGCGNEFCFKCNNPVHQGSTCEQNMEKIFSNYSQNRNIQFCPRCACPIEKNEGCNHMKCSSCHHEFCWVCKQPCTALHPNCMEHNGNLAGRNMRRIYPPNNDYSIAERIRVFCREFCFCCKLLVLMVIMLFACFFFFPIVVAFIILMTLYLYFIDINNGSYPFKIWQFLLILIFLMACFYWVWCSWPSLWNNLVEILDSLDNFSLSSN